MAFALLPRLGSAQVCLADHDQQFDSCTGMFYDSGGATGDHGNNEDVTVTICPSGGAGSGPSTSVLFLSWAMAGGAPTDQLTVYDGDAAIGLPLAVGNNLNSLAGQTFTSTHASGCLTFHWQSDASGTAAGWSARITTAPHPGDNTNTSICSAALPVSLFSLLQGSPDPGGSWKDPLGVSHVDLFDPAVDPGGNWTYTQSGPSPCPPASAILGITKVNAPDPGVNSNLSVCANQGPVSLFAALGGTPDPGGTWIAPGGGANNGTFIPGTDPAGVYTYTVTGIPPCSPASATVTVTVNQPSNAGTNGSTTVCSNNPSFGLITFLGGTPQVTGAWTGPGGSPVSATYIPGSSTPGVYTYTVPGTPPCPSVFATVTVTQITAPNAGIDRSITVCSDDLTFTLISELNGTPDAGGSWVGPGGAHGPNFNPATDVTGLYTYTVNGTAPCANASAVLNITVHPAPNPGTNGVVTLCSTDGVFTLFGALGGSPDVGGSWRDPANQPHSGSFTPGTSAPGVYTYTVVGLAPCDPASSTVTVTVNTAPNAGIGVSISRCSNNASFNLFSQLGGTPNAGGSWTGPLGAHSATFDPATDQSGPYTYTVLGLAPCANATAVVNVTVITAPDAGTGGSTTVCGNDAPFDLFTLVGGTPDGTGSWTGPGGGGVSNMFTPGTSAAGDYVYTVAGTAPCANAQSTVSVTVIAPPNPGTNGTITLCSNAASVDLFTLLGGSPQSGGAWTRPNGTAHSGTYQPASDAGGNYTYTVQGNAPCAALSAVVQVNRVIAPNAGVNGTITVCSTNSPFLLINVLGGTPNGSGSWIDPSLGPMNGTFSPGTSAPGTYAYIVPGTAPCVNDTGFVTVVVNTAPNAGVNSAITVCSSEGTFPLVDQLGGTPDSGGTWTRPNGTAHTGTFTPGTSVPGGYTYTVPGQTPCVAATAVVVVNVNQQPVAGSNNSFTRCSTSGPVDLFNQLNGSPDVGGTWMGPDGASSGVFIPGTSQPGDYVYTVVGVAPCINASATVTAIVNQAPNAGGSGDLTICQGTASVDLFTGLIGTYDLGGTWTEEGPPTGQLSGNFFTPSALPPGTYEFEYTVPGIGQCNHDDAHVDVTIVPQLEAGSNSSPSVCSSSIQVNLFSLLGGSPQPGGAWLDLDATGGLTGQYFNATLVTPGLYHFRYRLSGIIGCDSDSADVNLTVIAAPSPFTNGSTITCSNSLPFSLFLFLGGTPPGGGNWFIGAPGGSPFSGTYNPAANDPGDFYYVVSGTPPCGQVNARVTVSEVQAPNAGGNASTVTCSSGAPFNMTALLPGNPSPNGTWYFNIQNHDPMFVPGVDVQGIYEYRVQGQAPCTQAVAFLTISVITGANAGCNSSTTVCSGGQQFLLFNALTCNPQNNGSWLGPDLLPHNGTFNPATSAPGDYYYIITGQSPCVNDTALVSVFVNDSPNAGTSGTGSFCGSASAPGTAVNLITLLGGTPDPFGTWVGPAPGNPSFSGLFIPGVSTPGLYTYTVTNSCGSASATVSVQVNAPANAGCNNTITVCSITQAFPMVTFLGCTPTFGGQWTGPLPNTTVVTGVFSPGTTTPGTYRYRVLGLGACPAATALLTVNVNNAAFAGNDANLSLCNTDGQVNLFPLLGPGAQTGGSWFFNGVTPHSGTIQPSVDVTGTYVYRITGAPGCADHEASVFVQISTAPNAGIDGLAQVCSEDGPFSLILFITGNPQLNGNWTGPTGLPHSGIYDPAVDDPGLYTYCLPANGGCPADCAYVTVFESQAVDAGENGQTQVCSNSAPFALFGLLSGTPQSGGNWYDPNGSPFTGTYIPGVSSPGVYKYKRSGTAPCPSDSATVTVFQNTAANAGISTLASLCSTQPPVLLLSLLGGTPDNNGSWTYNNDPHGPFFDPALDPPGVYVYTVVGATPCPTVSEQVVITVTTAASAGLPGSLSACVDASAIVLFDGLEGTPDNGGTWSTNCAFGTLSNGIFDATGMPLDASCTFTYTQPANGPCAATSATVVLNIVDALDAGADSTVQACQGQLVDLFASLGGTPQLGGVWVNVDNAPGFFGSVFLTTNAAVGASYRFDHVLPGSAQCASDTARVTVTVLEGPYAGCDGSISTCSNGITVNMATALTCGPDGGGSWFAPDWTPHAGTFDPTADMAGAYHYIVNGIGACPADTANVAMSITPAANAGNGASLNICSTDASVNMFTLLGPNAQTGGNWFYVTGNVPHNGTYNPAVDAPGIYRYCVNATLPCAQHCAFINVTEPQAPNAGCSDSVTLCTSQAPILMRSYLGCLPQAGGSWVYVTTGGDVSHGNFFDPAVDLPGVYRYTIIGTAPCADASATLTVSVVLAGNAGESATVNACVSQTDLDVFLALGPNAQTGGSWTDQNTSGALTGNSFNPSMAGNGIWPLVYTILGTGPCPTVSSTVTVAVGVGGNAGADSAVVICGSETSYNLFNALGGNPTAGGAWSPIAGGGQALLPGGFLNATLLPIGGATSYAYTITDPGCGVVTAVVQVTTVEFPEPGTGTSLTLCVTGAPIDLFAQLGGSPDVSGVWTNPSNQVHTNVFNPGTDPAGNYTYTVIGNTPCPNASSVVSITLNVPPNAGTNGEVLSCDTLTSLDLFSGLQGTPASGGSWVDVDGSGGLSGGSLNTTVVPPGEYYFRYTVTVPGCGSATALVKVTVVTSVEVINETRICNERDRTYTVSFVIEQGDPATYLVTGLTGSISATPPYVFTSGPLFTSELFEVFVRDQYACGVVRIAGSTPCDFSEDVFIPESFSPNGDGTNELFLIPGIEGYPGNTITIFNRWGAKMYEASGYNNVSVVWDGTSTNGNAPAGTYFYVLELGNGSDAFTGYIYLNR